MKKLAKPLYLFLVVLLVAALLIAFILELMGKEPMELGSAYAFFMKHASPFSLALGLVFALTMGKVYPDFTKFLSKKMLQWSVIGLGFGMTLASAVATGGAGMMITIVSVFGTLGLGYWLGTKVFKVDWQTSYLISSGTAICGGSAIAATGPAIKAKAESMSVALGVVFVLNAIALFIFPPIGHDLEMTDQQFGTWAAIAIHDTSSVVGAGGAYSATAQQVATTVKLTRALWIVIVVIITPLLFKRRLSGGDSVAKPWYKSIPMFIIWFVCAILLNTFVLSKFEVTSEIAGYICVLAKHCITLSLFFIGCGLTRETLKAVGVKPLFQGVLLWIIIGGLSLLYCLHI